MDPHSTNGIVPSKEETNGTVPANNSSDGMPAKAGPDEQDQRKLETGSESLSWWRRTTSLPSSLNKRKNIWFQVSIQS